MVTTDYFARGRIVAATGSLPDIRQRPGKTVAAVLGLLALTWIRSFLGLFSLLLPILIFAVAARFLEQRQFAAVIVFISLTPLSVWFCLGVSDYARGTAALR
jgi:hypothetical protein